MSNSPSFEEISEQISETESSIAALHTQLTEEINSVNTIKNQIYSLNIELKNLKVMRRGLKSTTKSTASTTQLSQGRPKLSVLSDSTLKVYMYSGKENMIPAEQLERAKALIGNRTSTSAPTNKQTEKLNKNSKAFQFINQFRPNYKALAAILTERRQSQLSAQDILNHFFADNKNLSANGRDGQNRWKLHVWQLTINKQLLQNINNLNEHDLELWRQERILTTRTILHVNALLRPITNECGHTLPAIIPNFLIPSVFQKDGLVFNVDKDNDLICKLNMNLGIYSDPFNVDPNTMPHSPAEVENIKSKYRQKEQYFNNILTTRQLTVDEQQEQSQLVQSQTQEMKQYQNSLM